MASTTTSLQPPPGVILNQMLMASIMSQAAFVAAELGIADIVHSGAQTAAEIAARVDANPDAIHRILRALASAGIFHEMEGGKFGQTELSELLRSDVPGSMRAWARVLGADWQWNMLGNLITTARTGKKASEGLWGYFAEHPEVAHVFNQSMTSFSAAEIGPILASYDFSGIRRLVDVAGGYGSLLSAVLKANPGMEGVLFDAPQVIQSAGAEMGAAGVADRCRLASGDFFASVPAGADAYMMKHIIHDWDDENSLRILKNCHSAMEPGGKLLVIDAVIAPGNEPSVGKVLDIEMLLIGGRERTEADFRALFAAAGFELTRIVPTPSTVCVVEGVRG